MPELFWIIVGYTVILTLCFLLGEYLQDRRAANKRRTVCEEKPACPPEEAEHACGSAEDSPSPEEASSGP